MADRTFDILIRGDAKSALAAFAATQAAALKTHPVVAGAIGRLGTTTGRTFAGIATAAAIAGVGMVRLGNDFQEATHTIRTGTGATGDALETMKRSFDNVVNEVPASFGDAATAVADLNSILHITGEPLEQMAEGMLEISRMTGTDLRTNISAVARALNDYGIEAERMVPTLDKFFRVSQASGIEIAELGELVEKFGTPLRALGFSMDETIATFGEFHRQGVNIENVIPGLRLGLKRFAADGRKPADALRETFVAMQNADSQMEVTAIAFEAFGLRAGADLAGAVMEGRFSIEDMLEVVRNGDDTVMKAAEDTRTMGDNWKIFANRLSTRIKPVVEGFHDAISGLFSFLAREGVVDVVIALTTAFAGLFIIKRIIPLLGSLKVALRGITVIGIVFAVKELGDAIENTFRKTKTADVDQLTRDLERLGNTGRAQGEALQVLGSDFDDLRDAFKRVTDPSLASRARDVLTSVTSFGTNANKDLDNARQKFKDLDEAMTELFAKNPDVAIDTLRQVLEGLGVPQKELLELLPNTAGELDNLKLQAEDAGVKVDSLAELQKFLAESSEEVAAEEALAAQEMVEFQEAVGGLLQEMGNAGPAIAIFAQHAQDMGAEMEDIEGFVQAASDSIGAFRDKAVSHFQTAGEAALSLGEEFSLEAFRDELKKTFEQLEQFVPNINKLFEEGFPHLAQVAAEGGPLVAAALVKPFEDGNTDALAELELLAAGVNGRIAALPDEVTSQGIAIQLATGEIGRLAKEHFGDEFDLTDEADRELLLTIAAILNGEEPANAAGFGLGSSTRSGYDSGVSGMGSGIKERIKGINDRIAEQRDNAYITGYDVGAQTRDGYRDGVSGAKPRITEVMKGINDRILEQKEAHRRSGQDVGGATREGYGSGTRPMPGDATNRMKGVNDRIRAQRVASSQAGGLLGGNVRSGFASKLLPVTGDATNRMSTTFDRVMGQITGARRSGSTIGGGVRSGAREAMGPTTGDATNRMNATFRAIFGTRPSARTSGSSVGGEVRSGFQSGMKPDANFGSWFRTNVKDPVIRTWKKEFEIRSPSHVMMPIGRAVMQGFLSGMAKDKGRLDKFLEKFPELFAGVFGGIGKAMGGGAPGAGVQRWASVAAAALAYTGQSAKWLNDLLTQMAHESGGNPAAINLWDDNARRGIPSQGLMQTVPGTFRTYARELAGRGILDPFANIVAAIRYTVARYGSLGAWRARGFKGYESGGIVGAEGGFVHPGEMVLTHADQIRMLKMVRGTSSGSMIVNVQPGAVVIGVPKEATSDQARRMGSSAAKGFMDTISRRQVLVDARTGG